jgi:hypothetical protein
MEPSQVISVFWMFVFIGVLFVALLIEEGIRYMKINHRLTLDKIICNFFSVVEQVSTFSKSVLRFIKK